MDEAKEHTLDISYERYLEDLHAIAFNLFKQMEKEMGRSQALMVLMRAGEEWGRRLATQQTGGRELGSFREFTELWDGILSSPLWKGTQDYEVVEHGERHLRMRVTRCLWAETFLRLGDTEAGYLMCCYPDYAMVSAYSPDLELIRTKSIMQGDDHCNHCFRWKGKESKEALEDR